MKAGCVCARLPTTEFSPFKKKSRKEKNTGVERFGSYIAGFLQLVRTLWAPALDLGRGRGQAEGGQRAAGYDILLFVVVA